MALHNLTPNMYMSTAERFAELKHVRASEASRLLRAVKEMFSRKNDESELHKHVSYCLDCMTVFEEYVRRTDFFWSATDVQFLKDTMVKFQLCYIAACQISVEAGICRFGYPAKGHYFEHIVSHHAGLIPSRVWCYRYEDFMGRLVACAQRCIAGTPLTHVGKKVMENYRMALSVRLARWK